MSACKYGVVAVQWIRFRNQRSSVRARKAVSHTVPSRPRVKIAVELSQIRGWQSARPGEDGQLRANVPDEVL